MIRWNQTEVDFLMSNLQRGLSIENIAKCLGKTVMAVKLYCYRKNIPLQPTVDKPLLVELLKIKFGNPEFFHPTRDFFSQIGISQKRWSRLRQGYAQPTEEEMRKLYQVWHVTSQEAMQLFEFRQLSLFED